MLPDLMRQGDLAVADLASVTLFAAASNGGLSPVVNGAFDTTLGFTGWTVVIAPATTSYRTGADVIAS